ncbi:MAG TPA: hypothetical protein H9886_04935 [Candidatus Faecalicoccus intestinipullorum]|nr:hypothetical protein [Candidatus Faecalicoccus intestinipullorum]
MDRIGFFRIRKEKRIQCKDMLVSLAVGARKTESHGRNIAGPLNMI